MSFADDIMNLRYAREKQDGTKETWDEIATRVVRSVFSVVSRDVGGMEHIQEELIKLISQRKFIPGGRFLAQAGRDYHQVNNCFLLRAEDTREGWAELLEKVTRMLMSGGGIGVDYSQLRESGAILKRSGGTSSGPLPLMKVVNEVGRGVMAGGKRRSAIWAGLNWKHKDIFDFISSKDWGDDIKKAKEKNFDFPAPLDMTNISVILDKEFFDAYEDKNNSLHEHAHKVYWSVIENMVKTGEPGFSVDYENHRESLRNAPVCGDTMVLTKSGYKKVIDIVNKKESVFTGKRYSEDTVFVKTKSGASVVKVTMTGGREIRCDESHEFFVVKSGWSSRKKYYNVEKVMAKNLKKGERLLVSLPNSEIEIFTPNKDFYTLGYIYGDGSFSNNGRNAEITLCSDDSKKCLPYLEIDLLSSVTESDSRGYTRVYYKTSDFFSGRNKAVFPKELYEASSEEKASFVAGLWDSDGNISRKTTYRLSSIHYDFLCGVRRILESIGILSHINKAGFSTFGKKQTYSLVVSSESADAFSKKIPTVRVIRENLSYYKPYREQYIKVKDVRFDGIEDVYCANVDLPEHSFMAEGVIISNCTEIVSEDDSDVCCLGSLNLSKFTDIKEFETATELAQLFLIVGTMYSDVPHPKVAEIKERNRRTGLGLKKHWVK